MVKATNFKPDWLSAPGATIAAALRQREWSTVELAARLGTPLPQCEALVSGHEHITDEIAGALARNLGGSREFWLAREQNFRQSLRDHVGQKDWLELLPIADMTKFGWLPPTKTKSEKLIACQNFFGLTDLPDLRAKYDAIFRYAAFRQSESFDQAAGAVAAWLRKGGLEASQIVCSPWHPERLLATLPEIKALTRESDPRVFLPALQKLCARSGVAVVVVRAPNGCRASGATRFVTAEKAVLMLSFRFLSDDHFWFTFFHEVGHLLIHGRALFLEDFDSTESSAEDEANEFAENALIPEAMRLEFANLSTVTAKPIVKFAKKLGIAPGILVGQLQHKGLLKRNYFNALKRRYAWAD